MRNSNSALWHLVLGLAGVCLLAPAALAQEATLESRLREALRKTTADLHALQDQVETQQADLAKARAEADGLKKVNGDLQARLDDALKATAPAPPPAPAMPANDAALSELRANLNTANSRIAALQNQLAAADAAVRAKTADAQAQSAAVAKSLAATHSLVQLCHQTNEKLAGVANEILNTYKSESFRAVWLRSYEPLLGLDRVKLQNIMQDFEDRLRDQRLPAAPR